MTLPRTSAVPVASVLAASLALFMSGCSSNTKSDTPSGGGGGGGSSSSSTSGISGRVAFLMPDEGSTRYEQHDRPGFEKRLKELCPKCTPLYNNANADASKQQQQFNAALTQGAKVIVLDAVDTTAAASLVQAAHARNVKVVAYDRPIPSGADFYVSFDNERIGRLISTSLVDHLKKSGISATGGGLLEVNGSPTDAAAGLIKKGQHEGIATGSYKKLAEYDVPDWTPAKAQDWVAGQISRFGKQIKGVVAANDGTAGGAIAAFKAAGMNPVPPVSGNDAIDTALQLIISGDQYNTISKPSEIVGGAAADAASAFLSGKVPPSTAKLFNTPSKLFTPKIITRENIKTEIFDTKIASAASICTSAYAAACTKLGIS